MNNKLNTCKYQTQLQYMFLLKLIFAKVENVHKKHEIALK